MDKGEESDRGAAACGARRHDASAGFLVGVVAGIVPCPLTSKPSTPVDGTSPYGGTPACVWTNSESDRLRVAEHVVFCQAAAHPARLRA